MSNYSFNELQNKLDKLAREYVQRHPEYVQVAENNDAALKGQPPEMVREVLACYPGVVALAAHEEAHALYKSGTAGGQVQARQLAEAAHSRSGIDIHPGTRIGANCFIDHGTGVIIGETARIGHDTLIYHDVTLGAYGNPQERNPEKLAHRHPEIGANCTVSVGARVLGNVQVGDGVSIGTGAQVGDDNDIAPGVRIGAGAVVPRGCGRIEENVPPYSQLQRGQDGKLHVSVAVPQEFLQKFVRQRGKAETESGAFNYHI